MRKSIWEYIDLTGEEKKNIWDNGVFVFDTNVLLNLYRYSSKTGDALIDALKAFSDRIWIPHQVAFEFMKNRCEVIFDVCSKYDTFEKDKDDFLNKAKGLSNLKDTDEDIKRLRDSLDVWIKESRKRNIQVTNPNDDVVLNKILELFNEKTGGSYDSERKAELIKIGEKRFQEKTPPGYKDNKKVNDSCDNNAFGDFFVWMQIIDYAKENRKDIIFVTEDQKDDWWYRPKGKTVGPRIELRKEFYEATGQQFYMYSMNNFVENYSDKYNQSNDESVFEELKWVSRERRKEMDVCIHDLEREVEDLNSELLNLLFTSSDDPMVREDVQTRITNIESSLTKKRMILNLMKARDTRNYIDDEIEIFR